MESWQLGALIGILIMLNMGLIWRLETCHRSLSTALSIARGELVAAVQGGTPVTMDNGMIQTLKDELENSILDTIATMRTPTAMDHLGGVLANVIQMREQWRIQKEASEIQGNLISTPPVTEDYGGTTTQ